VATSKGSSKPKPCTITISRACAEELYIAIANCLTSPSTKKKKGKKGKKGKTGGGKSKGKKGKGSSKGSRGRG
jgi:hypothetical protein